MGRRSQQRALGLWMNGAFVGTWHLAPNAPDTLQYDPAWAQSESGRPLSLSLPFLPGHAPHRGEAVRAWFENLLPDSPAIRERLARRFHTGSTEAFDLLAEIGRDCVGALEILPEGHPSQGPGALQAEALSEAQIARVLRDSTTPTALGGSLGDQDFRISIAGAQEKTALLWHEGRWCLPRGSTPTTHIFKLPLGLVGGMKLDLRDSVENEWLCAQLIQAYGLPVAPCEMHRFENQKVLVVTRFDRRTWTMPSGEPRLLRLPQEDLCQATGVAPDAKYETDGGPGMDRIFEVLDGSMNRAEDRRRFFQAQLLFWMLCATDGHAKNFSLFLRPGGRYQLTPLYDVLSAHPLLGEGPSRLSPFRARLAMAVRAKNVHWKMREIQRRHWLALGARQGVTAADGQPAEAVIEDLIARTPQAIATVESALPKDFPARVVDSILGGVRDAARRLGDGAPAG